MKAIIFDMDGLMIDTEVLYHKTDREIAKSFGKDISEETLGRMMGRKPEESYAILCKDLNIAEPVDKLLKIRYEIMKNLLLNDIKPMPGLFEIIEAFKGKLKMAIATGSPCAFLEIALNKLNIGEFFDVLQPSDEVVNGKPDPEIYLRTVKKLRVHSQECIVIEDSSNGARAGKSAGCYTIAVPSEYTYNQDFSFVDYVAEDLKDAMRHICYMIYC